MENDLSVDVSRIESVLERSRVPVPAPPESDSGEKPRESAALREFILRAAAAGGMYSVLALKMAGTRAQKELLSLFRDERDTEKSLQIEHLLLTGDTAAVPASNHGALYLIKALRDAYGAELRNAADYDNEAGALPDCTLKALYFRLARRERSHAAVLRGIIERVIY